MPFIKKSVFIQIKEWLLVTLGILLYVAGWALFLIPNNLIGGGVSGISSMIQYATQGTIQMGYSYFTINAILLVAAFVVLGMGFGAKTVYAIILASVGLRFLPGMIPPDIVMNLNEGGKLMSVIMGGIMAGVGIGMAMSPGKVILVLDFIIIGSSLLVPSYVKVPGEDGIPVSQKMPFYEKLLTVVYGLILVTVNSHVLDLYISGSRQSVQLFILSQEYEKIADAITRDLNRGVTVLDGKGWYTKQDTKVLMVLTRKTDLNLLLRYIKQIDAHAFLSVSSVSGVYGKGFDTIKK